MNWTYQTSLTGPKKTEKPIRSYRTKRLISQEAEQPARGSAKNIKGAPLALDPFGCQRRRGVNKGYKAKRLSRVPVVDLNNKPLMPAKLKRVERWIATGKATPFVKMGILCVRLNTKTKEEKQPVVVGIDTGSKREALTVASSKTVFLNIQTSTPFWVSDKMTTRRLNRKGRRTRKTPCRKCRTNRSSYRNKGASPSILSRWNWKIRIINKIKTVYPITNFVVEDISATIKKNKRKWNKYFANLQIGKKAFYSSLREIGELELKKGYETKEIRDSLGLTKSKNKLKNSFESHCVDSYCLAWSKLGCPINKDVFFIAPLQMFRRQLHRICPSKGGERVNFGGTRHLGYKKGSLVKHVRHGVCYVSGHGKRGISVSCLKTSKRFSQRVLGKDLKFLSWNTFLIK